MRDAIAVRILQPDSPALGGKITRLGDGTWRDRLASVSKGKQSIEHIGFSRVSPYAKGVLHFRCVPIRCAQRARAVFSKEQLELSIIAKTSRML